MASAPTRMEQSELENIFNSLKPKQSISVWFDSAFKSANSWTELQVGRRSKSKKYNLEKISLIHPTNPKGRKDFLYNRQGRISFAIGDMATSLIAIKTNGKNAESFSADSISICGVCSVAGHRHCGQTTGCPCCEIRVKKYQNRPICRDCLEPKTHTPQEYEQWTCWPCRDAAGGHGNNCYCYQCMAETDESFSADYIQNPTRFYRNLGMGAALVAGLAYWFKK